MQEMHNERYFSFGSGWKIYKVLGKAGELFASQHDFSAGQGTKTWSSVAIRSLETLPPIIRTEGNGIIQEVKPHVPSRFKPQYLLLNQGRPRRNLKISPSRRYVRDGLDFNF
jgi:hypothetical protein